MATRHVGSGQTYPTINAAHTAASPGDTIIVHQGTYVGPVTISKANITVIANSGDTPIVTGLVDTGGVYSQPKPNAAHPQAGDWKYESNGYSYKWTPLVNITGANCIWDGVIIERSSGRGANANANGITIRNTEIRHCRGSAVVTFKDSISLKNIIFTNNVSFYANRPWALHPGCVGGPGATNLLIEDCEFYENQGENIMFDFQVGGAHDLIVRRTKVVNAREVAVYIHDTYNVLFEECQFFGSTESFYTAANSQYRWGGFTFKGVEDQYLKKGKERYGGISDVEVRNCLFVNMAHNVLLGGPGQHNSFVKDVVMHGNTFVSVTGAPCIAVGGGAGNSGGGSTPYTNFVMRGNAFYVTGNPSLFYQGHKAGMNLTWQNNAFNKGNIPLPCIDNANVISNNGGANFYLQNPGHRLLKTNSSKNNYQIVNEPASVLVDKYTSPPQKDGYGNTRVVPSAIGFHDPNATTFTPEDPIPMPGFDIYVGGQVVSEVPVNSAITFDNTSTPSSGETITGQEWLIKLKNTSVQSAQTTVDASYTPTIVGDWIATLTVTQSNGEVATHSKNFKVFEPVIEYPPPEPPTGQCDLNTWSQYVKSGFPTMSVFQGVRVIDCPSGSSGSWYSYWGGTVTPGNTVRYTLDYKLNLTAGQVTFVILWYNSSGTLLDPSFEIVNYLNNTSNWTAYSKDYTVPAGAAKARFEVRLWSSPGRVEFKNACLRDTGSDPAPAPAITAEVNSVALASSSVIDLGTQVDFDSSSSTATASPTYTWQVYRVVTGLVAEGDPGTASTFSYTFDTTGSFVIQLRITQTDGQTNYTRFYLDVTDPLWEVEVWFEKYLTGYPGEIGKNPIYGWAPLEVNFEAFYSDAYLNEQVNYIIWKLLDSDRNPIKETKGGTTHREVLPPDELQSETEFGMRMLVVTHSGVTRVYQEYNTITVAPRTDVIIGPPIPGTSGAKTFNQILEDGTHTHKITGTEIGEPGELPVISQTGDLFLQLLSVGHSIWSDEEQDSRSQILPYVISLLGGIIARDELLITAPGIRLDSGEVSAPKLPTADPKQDYVLWIDPTTRQVRSSVGVATEGGPGGGGSGTTSVTVTVSAGIQDAAETTAGVVSRTQTLLRLEGANSRLAFFFDTVNVPNSATIVSATLEIWIHQQGVHVYADVSLEDSATPAGFLEQTNNLTNRTATTGTTIDEYATQNSWHTLSLPTADVQAIVNKAGWAANNDMVVFLDEPGGSDLAIGTYDLASSYGAKLTIEYST